MRERLLTDWYVDPTPPEPDLSTDRLAMGAFTGMMLLFALPLIALGAFIGPKRSY